MRAFARALARGFTKTFASEAPPYQLENIEMCLWVYVCAKRPS